MRDLISAQIQGDRQQLRARRVSHPIGQKLGMSISSMSIARQSDSAALQIRSMMVALAIPPASHIVCSP
jgi:hypothetical protein